MGADKLACVGRTVLMSVAVGLTVGAACVGITVSISVTEGATVCADKRV